MDRIVIRGGTPLNGVIPISGAKNAALPLMIASLLTEDTLELVNVPRLADVQLLLRILGNHGVDHTVAGKRPGQSLENGQTLRLSARDVIDTTAPYDLVSRMRASFWVIAPLVARFGEARHVDELERVLGEQARDHQRQGRILGARDRNHAVERRAAPDHDTVHSQNSLRRAIPGRIAFR